MDFWGFEGREEMVGGKFGLLMADPAPAGGVSGPAAAPATSGNQTPVWENKIKEAETKLESHPDFKKNLEGNKDFLAQFNGGKKPETPGDFLTAIKNAKTQNAKDTDTRFMAERETKLKELESWVKKEYQPRLDAIGQAKTLYQSNRGQDAEKADNLLMKAGLLAKKEDQSQAPQNQTTTPAAPGGQKTVTTQSALAGAPQQNSQPAPQQQPPAPSAGQQYINTMNTAAAATAATFAPITTALGAANVARAQVQSLSGLPGYGGASYGYNTGGFGFGASAGPYGTSVGLGGGVGGFDPLGSGFGVGVETDEARERSRRTEAEIQQLLAAIMSGNMDAIASALILMTFKAKQTMLKAAALVVRAMQLYDKQMEGQNEKMKALAGKGYNQEIGQQFEIARQEMNQISTQRQSISNNLRDIMSMVEEIGNNEKGFLDKKFQIQSSQSRWV